ncbi:bifunctional adenosylcobinamide kinase/adenosylcobinamide-phosphate guanylyltransferase [Metabacillus bambusae]|uniref:Adenosylcobinamide kinase n=1 Tax=Metabacillus bambusae TaxID=2795218 RepID=A0ABS3N7R2_9BACI|nr:bifunctional adenosylcobinamide kinase/adenosylcobinamide-phosphate guanylyltransferase [Metabacillus bambusae]MBO1514337.1 bifunctional adenosylcobinamide kinase/adenosylcobinamide-phosphate guanylyltransferase [Metabacillus bambusae]
MITFISGGARSGKSSFAENYALELFKKAGRKETLLYIATAERTDCEMENRITRHIVERESIWHTIEAPIEVTRVLQTVKEQEVILLDCLTVWINNMLYKGKTDIGMILEEVSKWIKLAEENQLELIIVSNDVNEGIQSDNLFIHEYIYKLQKVHSLVTSKAESVYQVVAGIPIKWKG